MEWGFGDLGWKLATLSLTGLVRLFLTLDICIQWTDNIVTEGEPASQLLHHILHTRLGVDPTEHPLMITEPAWNTPKAREMLTEMVFEGEKMPALYFGSQGVTSALVNSHSVY